MTGHRKWTEVRADMHERRREIVADREAYASRTARLRVKMGRHLSRLVYRVLFGRP